MISGLSLRLIGQSIRQPLQKLDKTAAVRSLVWTRPHEQPACVILTWAHPASIETGDCKVSPGSCRPSCCWPEPYRYFTVINAASRELAPSERILPVSDAHNHESLVIDISAPQRVDLA